MSGTRLIHQQVVSVRQWGSVLEVLKAHDRINQGTPLFAHSPQKWKKKRGEVGKTLA
jgi:hypothetical protein